jgi:hypothetical protein
MTIHTRRSILISGAAVAANSILLPRVLSGHQTDSALSDFRIAPFRFDVTPPLGHSLCGGWIAPATTIEDPLEAIGFVILGAGDPIVICAVDWTGILNEAHVAWRSALAEAAHTTADRVAVQCVHQHDAPFACLEAQRIVRSVEGLPDIVEVDFFNRCLDAGREAIDHGLKASMPLTHVATSQAQVKQVASNRRIMGLNGVVTTQRGSSSKDPEHHAFPEGLIDPYLKTVAFYSGEAKVVSCHYYACHPMSHYGKGNVSADFCGLARKKRQSQEPGCTHLYFNGCGGNIGAGKYNDGTPEMRPVLVERMLAAIVESEASLQPARITSLVWGTENILPPTRAEFKVDELLKQIADTTRKVVDRNRPSYTLAWHRRFEKQIPIVLSALQVNQASLLHLPAESFVEYQLRAQATFPKRFVACAAYGDGGPWYIPVAEAYEQGGYETSVSWCDKQIDILLSQGIAKVLKT